MIFNDDEFKQLPLERQTKIMSNYFNKELADEDFYKLDNNRQNKIRENFLSKSFEEIGVSRELKTAGSYTATVPSIKEAPLPPFQLKNGELVETKVETKKDNSSLLDKVLGGLETGATFMTGSTGGAIGNVYGAAKGMGKEILTGDFGTPEAAKRIEKESQKYGNILTYNPKTEKGQEYLEDTASSLVNLEALTPLGSGIKAATNNLKTPNAIKGGYETYNNNKIEKKALKTIENNEKKALKQGVEENVLKTIKTSSNEDKEKMARMLDILEKGKDDAEYKVLNRPSDIVGETLGNKVDFLLDTNRKAGSEIELAANNLKGKPINSNNATQNLISNLDKIGISLTRKDGKTKIKLKGSDVESDTKSEKLLKRVFERLPNSDISDGYDIHNLKRFLDTQIDYEKSKSNPLSKKTENIIKKFRKELNDSLGDSSSEYKNANTKFSETIKAIKAIQKSIGKKVDLTSPSVSKSLGVASRKLMSNYSSRGNLIDALQNSDDIAKKYGFKSDNDLIKQVVFANEIDRLFGSQAPTSLKGQQEQAIDRVVDFARSSNTEKGLTTIKAISNKLRGINDENAIKALQDVLNNKTSKDNVFKDSFSTPSKNSIFKEAFGKFEDSVFNQQPAVSKKSGFNAMAPVKSKAQKEKRGIYNVTFNGKNSSEVRKADGESILRYNKGNNKYGATHIKKHLGDGKIGEVSNSELLNIGNIIRNGTLSNSYGKNVYELTIDGVTYKVVTTGKDNDKIITFYSNRNIK